MRTTTAISTSGSTGKGPLSRQSTEIGSDSQSPFQSQRRDVSSPRESHASFPRLVVSVPLEPTRRCAASDAHFMIVHLKGKMYEQETGLNYRKLNEICTDGWNKLGCDIFQNLVDHLHTRLVNLQVREHVPVLQLLVQKHGNASAHFQMTSHKSLVNIRRAHQILARFLN